MELTVGKRIKRAWNAFLNRAPTHYGNVGMGSGINPSRARFTRGNERSIVNSIFNRIAMDVAALDFKHCQLDANERYQSTINTSLNNCLTLEANIDQTSRAFIQDIVMSLFDEGAVAVVPIDTNDDTDLTDGYDIETMRVGKIIEWYPRHVKVLAYNDQTGRKQEIIVAKSDTAIIENPFYAITNEPNSSVQRLIRKLNLLDVIDEHNGSDKLDLIIQLPYTVKTPAKKAMVEERRKEIEDQLTGSKYGIAYIDSTEHITQLNRSLENNLLKQIELLINMVYSQLSITTGVMDGTADEQTMLNYNNRTIEPFASAITNEFKRKFLSKNARTRGQTILFFRNPFKLVPINNIAEIADKLTRNEILSTNEVRSIVGMKPVADPLADQLRNKNLNPGEQQDFASTTEEDGNYDDYGDYQNDY